MVLWSIVGHKSFHSDKTLSYTDTGRRATIQNPAILFFSRWHPWLHRCGWKQNARGLVTYPSKAWTAVSRRIHHGSTCGRYPTAVTMRSYHPWGLEASSEKRARRTNPDVRTRQETTDETTLSSLSLSTTISSLLPTKNKAFLRRPRVKSEDPLSNLYWLDPTIMM